MRKALAVGLLKRCGRNEEKIEKMRQDKLTTKFQQALGEAQSLALAHDNQYIEPVHLLLGRACTIRKAGPRA